MSFLCFRNIFVKIEIARKIVRVGYSFGVPVVAQWLTNPTRNHEGAGSIPGLAQWIELWCGSQTWLGSRAAVALA